MPDVPIEESLLAILTAVEASAECSRELVNTCKALMHRDEELGDGLADLERRLSFVATRSRVILLMKASTLETTCLRCGAVFAKEPGPELCGPCWTELGRPTLFSVPAPTA